MIKPAHDDYTVVYETENVLQKKIGNDFSLDQIFSPERIKKCQNVIDQAKASFFETAKNDLESLLSMSRFSSLPLNKMATLSENIKGQARIFGFSFISAVCDYITDVCMASTIEEEKKKFLLKKLIEVLEISFKEKITDEGGALNFDLSKIMKKINFNRAK